MRKIKKLLCICLVCFCTISFCFVVGCRDNSLEKNSKTLTNYSLNLSFDDNSKVLSGQEYVKYKNNYDTTLNYLQFHLYPNAFRSGAKYSPVSIQSYSKCYPNGFSTGNISIKELKVENENKDINILGNDENILKVELNEALYPDDVVNIYLAFEIVLPNCIHRFGYGDNTYNFGNFYPIACVYENGSFKEDNYGANGDPFYSEMANYDVNIKYNEDFVLASTGSQTNTVNESNCKTTSIVAKSVRDFAFVISKKFLVLSKMAGDTTVFYYYYDDENCEKSLQAGVDAINTFSDIFGQYPYSTYSVVKTNFVHGGMEYPNLVYISDSVENIDDYLNVIVHETAHQWWYNLVGSNACEYAWLDEGLTEFSTLMFYRYNSNYSVIEQESLNASLSSYILFSEIYESVYGNFNSSMSRNVNSFSGEMEYTYVTYVKGVLFFDNLESLVGEKNFLKALKYYYKSNKYGNATPSDMISAFEVVSKRDLSGFFNSWIEGKVILQNYS